MLLTVRLKSVPNYKKICWRLEKGFLPSELSNFGVVRVRGAPYTVVLTVVTDDGFLQWLLLMWQVSPADSAHGAPTWPLPWPLSLLPLHLVDWQQLFPRHPALGCCSYLQHSTLCLECSSLMLHRCLSKE